MQDLLELSLPRNRSAYMSDRGKNKTVDNASVAIKFGVVNVDVYNATSYVFMF